MNYKVKNAKNKSQRMQRNVHEHKRAAHNHQSQKNLLKTFFYRLLRKDFSCFYCNLWSVLFSLQYRAAKKKNPKVWWLIGAHPTMKKTMTKWKMWYRLFGCGRWSEHEMTLKGCMKRDVMRRCKWHTRDESSRFMNW